MTQEQERAEAAGEFTLTECRARQSMHPYRVTSEATYRATFTPPSRAGAMTETFRAASSSDARSMARRFLSSFGSSAHGWSISIRKLSEQDAADAQLVNDYRNGRALTAEQEARAESLFWNGEEITAKIYEQDGR